MYSLEKRVGRITRELEKRIYSSTQAVAGIEIRRGKPASGVSLATIKDGWASYEAGSPWAIRGADDFALFRARLVIPAGMSGKPVVIRYRTNKNGWDACDPQLLLYIDGVPRQAFDANHQMALLCPIAEAGANYMLHLSAFGGLNVPDRADDLEPVKLFIDLAILDKDVRELYFDMNVPLIHSGFLQQDSAEWAIIMDALNEACNIVDLRMPGSPEFYVSVLKARESLNKSLYDKPSHTLPVTMSCIGQTHIDVAWLWRYCHTREKTARSFSTVLALMDEYPDFLFTMSQPQLFAYLKEDYPEIYKRVKERIKEGRFEVEGGMWVESDTNLPSGESLVRQFLHGKRFFREEFGRESRILWLPDVFGYSAALPQIIKKSGIDYFMTSKLRNNELNKMPHNTFMWKGIDGSEILTQLTSYNPNFYNGQAQNCDMLESWQEYQDKALTNDLLYTYGYGDGGGGPTREMVETIRRFKKGLPGAAKTRFSTARDFFARLDKKVSNSRHLATWQGELYYEYHRGTYTSMAKNKKNNRKAEFLLGNAEWAAVLDSHLLGADYPGAVLDTCWKTLLLNQFHDVLPGSSIREVYDDTDIMYAELFRLGGSLVSKAAGHIAANVNTPSGSLIVFNPLSWERETAVTFEIEDGEWALSDGISTFPAQKRWCGGYVSIVRGIPPKGWLSLQIVAGRDDGKVKASATLLENTFVTVKLDAKGKIRSLYDKKAGRETFRKGESGNSITACEDKPYREDNWNLDNYYGEKTWDIPASKLELVEQGPVRAVIRITRTFMNSTIVQHMILWRYSPRLDFDTIIDWKDKDICLKAGFPIDVNASSATYEIQYGHIVRNTHENTSWDAAKFEVCAHKWADLSDGGFGMSLLNDCKYGYDALKGNLRLTLLRSTCNPNPDADKEIHSFTYSILPHAGDWRAAGTVRQAYEINVPAVTVIGGGGTLPRRMAFAEVSDENIILETVKRAEDGDGIILRFYDAWNKSGACKVNLCATIESAEECNLLENSIHDACYEGDSLEFDYKPFEIKTFRLRLKLIERT